jgi:hypothetical protein
MAYDHHLSWNLRIVYWRLHDGDRCDMGYSHVLLGRVVGIFSRIWLQCLIAEVYRPFRIAPALRLSVVAVDSMVLNVHTWLAAVLGGVQCVLEGNFGQPGHRFSWCPNFGLAG